MEKEFSDSLKLAFELCGNEMKFEEAKKRIDKIGEEKNFDEIRRIKGNKEDDLYKWIPAIVFNIWGYDDGYKNPELNVDSNQSVILYRPNIDDFSIIDELRAREHFVIERYEYCYSPELVASLYGGFPWFKSLIRIAQEYDLFNRKGIAYFVKANADDFCVNKLVKMKNEFRKKHPEQIIERRYSGEKWKGELNPFHTPNCIENDMHMDAIKKALVKEGDIIV